MNRNDIVQRLHERAVESKQVLLEHLESLRLAGGDSRLDLAVAKAIGLQSVVMHSFDTMPPSQSVLITSREWDEIRGIEHRTCEGDVACIPFQPGVDLNAAFAAAFSAGLFNEATLGPFVLRPGKRRSFVVRETLGGEDEAVYAYGDTPALAICGAILELKKPSGD